MIHSRTHATIDYAVSAGLAALALSPVLSGRARTTLGAAAAYHTGYATLTAYEGGAVPLLSMERHLLLDVAGAGGILLAGMLGPRQDRALLLAIGAAEFAVVALSERRARGGPPETVYVPLEVPKPVDDGIWIVDSAIGPGMPVRMTVIRLPNGELLLHSPTRYDAHLRRALEGYGRIRHLVAPNIVHWTFIKGWQNAMPETEVWAAPGLQERAQVRRSGLRIDHELGETAPAEWADSIEHAIVPGGAGWTEVAMFHRPSRTLLLTDLVVNIERPKLPWPLRPAFRLLGALAPSGRAPAYLRGLVRLGGGPAASAARRIVGWAPERVLFAHGRPFERDATSQLRRSLAWLTG